MATISTSQTFDSAARTAGEAFTIQSGAVFTIDSDTRDGKNAAAARAGSMSSFTMTSATGGQVVIDGTKVWLHRLRWPHRYAERAGARQPSFPA